MDIKLTDLERKQLIDQYNDLKIQAMLFDMDIDIETLSLTEKRKDTEPQWLKNWKQKQRQADNDPASPEQAGW